MGNSNSTSTDAAPAVVSANAGPGSLGWFFPIVPSLDEVKVENPGAVDGQKAASTTITVVVETPTSSNVPAVPGKPEPGLEEWKGTNKVAEADHAYGAIGAPIAEFYLEPGSDRSLPGPFAAFGADRVGKGSTEDPGSGSLSKSHEDSTEPKPIRVHVLVENAEAAGDQNPHRLPEAPVPTHTRGRPVSNYDDDHDRHVEEKYYDQSQEHPAQPAALPEPREHSAQEWADRACSRANELYPHCRFPQNDMFSEDYLKLVEAAAAAAAAVEA